MTGGPRAIRVEVFAAPGCRRCDHAQEVLREVADEFGVRKIQWRAVNVLEELDYAVELRILSLPAIVIDGELVFPSLPSPTKLRRELTRRLADGHGSNGA